MAKASPVPVELSNIPDLVSGLTGGESNVLKRVDEITGRYLTTGGIKDAWNSFNLEKKNPVKTIDRLVTTIDYAMALFSERQVFWGSAGMSNYPRTVFVLSDILSTKEKTVFTGFDEPKKGEFLTLYPEDVDQIIVFSTANTNVLGLTFSATRTIQYMFLSILKLDYNPKSKNIEVYHKGMIMDFQKGGYGEELVKLKENHKKVITNLLPKTIFGSDFTFVLKNENDPYVNLDYTSSHDYILYAFMDMIEYHSRNAFQYTDVNHTPEKTINQDLMKSLYLGYITFIVPSNLQQRNENVKIGRVTKERMQIINGIKTSSKDMMGVHSNFNQEARVYLLNCHSDEEW